MARLGSTDNHLRTTPEHQDALANGKRALADYLQGKRGRGAEICRRAHILPAILSKMAHREGYPIGVESAILIEVATEGAVKAEQLCPWRADVLGKLFALRSGENVKG